MGSRNWAEALRRRQQDESGAEMIEFAVVVVLLLMVIYGMVSVGLSLAARESVNQAVADGARFGIVQPMGSTSAIDTAETGADNQTLSGLGWLGLGTSCSSSKVTCKNDASTTTACPTSFTSGGANMCVSATTAACTSNTDYTCLTVAVNYYYTSAPIFPLAPGFNLITPSDISSSSTMQVSTTTAN